jgi:hypothetical protein
MYDISDRAEGTVTEVPDDVDPALAEHVTAIRNRFGVDGLRQARQLIDLEIAIFDDVYGELEAPPGDAGGPPTPAV